MSVTFREFEHTNVDSKVVYLASLEESEGLCHLSEADSVPAPSLI